MNLPETINMPFILVHFNQLRLSVAYFRINYGQCSYQISVNHVYHLARVATMLLGIDQNPMSK